MRHITAGEKSVLVGDDVSALLLEYAALIARIGSGDTVQVNAIGADGSDVVVTFLLNSGTVLVAETSFSSEPEPENVEAERYLRERLGHFDSYELGPAAYDDDGAVN